MSEEEFSNRVNADNRLALTEREMGEGARSKLHFLQSSVWQLGARVPLETAGAAVAPRTQVAVRPVFIGKANVSPH